MGKLADLATRCLDAGGQFSDLRLLDYEIEKIAGHDSEYTSAYYTTYIDSALTFIPSGWRWSLEYVDGYSASVNSGNGFGTLGVAEHPTSPALAMCAAALRARDLVEVAGA